MIAARDVRYDEDALIGRGAAVIFERWEEAVPLAEYTAAFNGVSPYLIVFIARARSVRSAAVKL